jgi:hypothetical protein
MMTRRKMLLGAAASGAVASTALSCSSGSSTEQAARSLRRPIAVHNSEGPALLRELVRYATLAPSSHNTQCWKFRLQERSITIEPDLTRRCPVVDPDDHHLFVSLGCATENLAHAALANGLQASAGYDSTGAGTVAVRLEATEARSSPLFHAMPERQCTRGDYDGQSLSTEELRLLEQAGTSTDVRLLLLTESTAMEKVLEYVVTGNTAQMNNAAFVDELKAWIRFGADEAVRSGDGLFSGASGNPALPRWLGSRMMGMFFTPKTENDRYAKQIRNSAGIAVFVSGASDKAHWVEAGRSYERFALQATALGIRNAFLNQPTAVRLSSRLGEPTARSGGALWPWGDDAFVHATASAGRAGLISSDLARM